MAGLQNDTSELRAWLASQLKLEVIPELIWDDLVEERYVKEAQNLGLPDGREELLRQARRLLNAYRAGADAGPAPKKQPTGKRQKATAKARSEVVAEIATKIAMAKGSISLDASPNGDEEKPNASTPELLEFNARTRAFAESPLMWTIENNRITVRAEPWVSPDDVRKSFKNARDMWFWAPTPSERRVELVRFVTGFCRGYHNEERGVSGLVPGRSWRHIMEQWNQHYPHEHDWHYADVRRFRRDFKEGFETLTLFEDF
jgi:hypothetical protein